MNTVTKTYQTDINIVIEPVFKDLAPRVRIWLDDNVTWTGEILSTRSFDISKLLSRGSHHVAIELYDKSDQDAYQGIIIKDLCIGNISSQKFVWQGCYRPRYPEPWATEQKTQGIALQEELTNTDYLGWNGTWRLEFSVPVFTWIHQIENLGWLYD